LHNNVGAETGLHRRYGASAIQLRHLANQIKTHKDYCYTVKVLRFDQ